MRRNPDLLNGILSYWYCEQKYGVRRGNVFLSYFEISNGIRRITGECVNHKAYADDMAFFFAPSIKAL